VSLVGPEGAVAGTTGYDAEARMVSFTPAAPLKWSTGYTVTVTVPGVDVVGGDWSFTTAAEPVTLDATTIFGDALPQNGAWNDPADVQVATRFKVDVAGEVTGVRFYKGAANTGAHTGYLWNGDGTQLAQVVFVDETAEGWQVAQFVEPVQLLPGIEYRVGLHSTTGRYAADIDGLTREFTTGHFTVPRQGGAYTYSSAFPSELSWNNFWVDVLFTPAG
jgi:hypothetical protein